ncbi:MAG: riboflavin biosynthesis protein RibF [Eggerthellaceae bacterium]|nr:riboflavin biosynthesis protein RibF [Eggerthellaceae bacterium]
MAEIFKSGSLRSAGLLAGASCAFGVFDGVHTGHRYLIDEAIRTASASGGASVALTFDIDPDELLHANRLKKLLGNADRIDMLSRTGVDAVVVISFTPSFASELPGEFLVTTFGKSAPAHLHVGHEFRCGAKASGTVENLQEWSACSGPAIHAHSLVSSDGTPITATRIRLLLLDGDLDEANQLLGYPYTLTDVVTPGRGDGAAFGFATANMEIAANKRVLAEGVYGGYAMVGDERYRAAIAVGVSPLFKAESTANVEVHLLDFEGDLYGRTLSVQFLHRIRPMTEFASTEELVATVLDNIEWVRNNLPL